MMKNGPTQSFLLPKNDTLLDFYDGRSFVSSEFEIGVRNLALSQGLTPPTEEEDL